jgi:hypothetical protein
VALGVLDRPLRYPGSLRVHARHTSPVTTDNVFVTGPGCQSARCVSWGWCPGPPSGTRWASHDVHHYRSGTQPFCHPLVGDLTLNYEALDLTADIGLTIVVYTAEPDSPSQQALNRLKRWSTPPNETPPDPDREHQSEAS